MELILATVIGYSISTFLSIKIIYDCLYKRKMEKNLRKMEENNKELSESVSNFQIENDKLSALRKDMEENGEQLKTELDELKGIINLGGEQNEEVYQNLRTLYNDYKDIVDIDVKVKCIGLLTDLDTNNDFKFDEKEKEEAKMKLRLLFSEKKIDISDSDFDDLDVLKNKLYELIMK